MSSDWYCQRETWYFLARARIDSMRCDIIYKLQQTVSNINNDQYLNWQQYLCSLIQSHSQKQHKTLVYYKLASVFQPKAVRIVLITLQICLFAAFLDWFQIYNRQTILLLQINLALTNMATPLKLKRISPFIETTMDRTFHPSRPKQQLKNILPCFTNVARQTSPKYQVKPSFPQGPAKGSFSCTGDLEERIYQYIRMDDQKSQFSGRNGLRNKVYTDVSSRMKIVRNYPWSIPLRVTQMYAEQQTRQNKKINFNHGCLPKSGIYYFSVQNKVLFYDVATAVRYNKKLEDCLLQLYQFQDTVFELKEIDWAVSMFKQLRNKNILVISSPWSIYYSVLEVSQGSFKQNQTMNRWMKITMLNYSFTISSMRALCITQGNEQLFYVDEAGRVNKLGVQSNDVWGKIVNGRKYKMTNISSKQGLSKNYFYQTKKSTIVQKIKHYTKVIACEVKNLYKSNPSIDGLVYDKKRNLLFSLIDSHSHKQSRQSGVQYSYSKLLSCWKVIDGRLVLQCQISQVQLLTANGNDQLFSHNIGKNNKISRIMRVEQCYYPDSCVLAVLNSGIRLYLRIQDDSFQICTYEYPPSFEIRTKSNQRKAQEYTKNVELGHFYSNGCVNFMTVRQDDTNHSFYIWKDDEQKQYESVCHISWKQSFKEGECGQIPLQSYLFRCQLSLSSSKKKMVLSHLQKKMSKYPFLCSENYSYNHQLARDVFEDVPLYIHSTDTYIQSFFILRPIDLVYMIIKAGVFDKKVIKNVATGLDRKDLQVILIQLLCDGQGLYVMDIVLTQCINSYNQKCLELNNYRNFENYRDQFFRQIALNKAKKIPLKESEPELQGRQEINEEQYKKICELILELSQQQSSKSKNEGLGIKYYEELNSITNSILCYLSRILRYVWMLQITQIPSKAVYLVDMLQPILHFINAIFDKQYISRAKCQLYNDYSKTVDNIKRIQTFFPIVTKNQKEENQRNLESSFEMVDKLKYFINKTMQLILMATQSKLDIKKKFHSCLALEPEFFESYIFNYLIINYNQPFKILQTFQQSFPLFIGRNLQKSLKIYNQTKNLNSKQIYQTAKQHHNLPDYLLAYLKSQKGMRSSQIREIRDRKEAVIQIAHTSGSKEMVQELLSKVNQQYLNYFQRKKLVFLAKKELEIYKNDKKMGEDRFYLQTTRQLNQLQKKVEIQQILLDEYTKEMKIHDSFVMDQLKNGLCQLDKLKQIVQSVNEPKISIVFLYFFKSVSNQQQYQQQLKQQFKTIFENCYSQFSKQSKKDIAFSFSKMIGVKNQKVSWNNLQKIFMFIIGKARKYINVLQLVQIIAKSQEAVQIASQKQPTEQTTQVNTLSSLFQYLKQNQKPDLQAWILTNQYLIVSLILVRSGIEYEVLTDIYLKIFEEYSFSHRKITLIYEVGTILHYWINLHCLMFEYESEKNKIMDFIDFTKMFLKKMSRNPIKTFLKGFEQRMGDLAKLLITVRLAQEKISADYLQFGQTV